MQIAINDNDYVIKLHLEANTILPGTYINADYNIPEDYRIQQLNKIADKFVTQATLNEMSDVNQTKSVKNATTKYITNTKIISNHDDIKNHFAPADDKYFVTGYTDSKFELISKFFKKTDVLNYTQKNNDFVSTTLVGDKNNVPVETVKNLTDNKLVRTNIKFLIPGLDISAMILVDDPLKAEYVLYLDTENPIKYVDFGTDYTIFSYMRSNIETPETSNIILYDGFVEEPKIISEVFIDRGLNSGFEKIKKLKNATDLNELNKMGLGFYRINKKGYNFKNK